MREKCALRFLLTSFLVFGHLVIEQFFDFLCVFDDFFCCSFFCQLDILYTGSVCQLIYL